MVNPKNKKTQNNGNLNKTKNNANLKNNNTKKTQNPGLTTKVNHVANQYTPTVVPPYAKQPKGPVTTQTTKKTVPSKNSSNNSLTGFYSKGLNFNNEITELLHANRNKDLMSYKILADAGIFNNSYDDLKKGIIIKEELINKLYDSAYNFVTSRYFANPNVFKDEKAKYTFFYSQNPEAIKFLDSAYLNQGKALDAQMLGNFAAIPVNKATQLDYSALHSLTKMNIYTDLNKKGYDLNAGFKEFVSTNNIDYPNYEDELKTKGLDAVVQTMMNKAMMGIQNNKLDGQYYMKQ